MNLQTCLQKLKLIGTLDVANVAADGSPQVRCISAFHYEPDAVYFLTSRGKPFACDLQRDGRIQAVGRTRFNEMIRLSGTAVALEGEEGVRIRDLIYEEQPYLANVYPGNTRDINIIFAVRDAQIGYFNLGVHPIFRETYRMDGAAPAAHGYRITDECIGCGTCLGVCPQGAIEEGSPFRIESEHCLHCGACFEACPVSAIERLRGAAGADTGAGAGESEGR